MEAALAGLESQESPNYTATVKKYGADRSTLSRDINMYGAPERIKSIFARYLVNDNKRIL